MEGILTPILFTVSGVHLNLNPVGRRGVPPSMRGFTPLPAARLWITGITKDSTGAALGFCTVQLFRTADDLLFEEVISDASGAYAFSAVGLSETYYVVAYKVGAPDVAGTTVDTLIGA